MLGSPGPPDLPPCLHLAVCENSLGFVGNPSLGNRSLPTKYLSEPSGTNKEGKRCIGHKALKGAYKALKGPYKDL